MQPMNEPFPAALSLKRAHRRVERCEHIRLRHCDILSQKLGADILGGGREGCRGRPPEITSCAATATNPERILPSSLSILTRKA